MDDLETYLQSHWAAAAGGVDLAARIARSHRGAAVGPVLAAVAEEIAEDQAALRQLMESLGLRPGRVGPLVARAGERVGRLKPNGRVVRRSPVSDVLELEALRGAVMAKRGGWDALVIVARSKLRLQPERIEELRARADGQLESITSAHAAVVADRFGS